MEIKFGINSASFSDIIQSIITLIFTGKKFKRESLTTRIGVSKTMSISQTQPVFKNSSKQRTPSPPPTIDIQSVFLQIQTNYQNGLYELALPAAFELLNHEDFTQNKQILIQVGLIVSKIYRQLGCIPHSIQFVQKAFEMIEKGDARLEIAHAYHLIGNIFSLLADYQQAFIYLSKGLEIYHYLNYKPGLADCYALIAEINLPNQDYEQVRFYIQKSLTYSNLDCLKNQQSNALNTLGFVFLQTGQYGNAARKIQQALTLAKEIQSPYEIIRANFYLALLARHQNEVPSALSFAENALRRAQKLKTNPLQRECHLLFKEIYQQQNDFQKAFFHLEQAFQISEQHKNHTTFNQLRAIEINYKIELYSQRNHQLKKEIQQRTKDQAELEYLATTDPLTSLYNRRYFFTLAEHICEQSQKSDKKLCALMMDIDHFKNINDENGHPFGDKVLVAISNMIQKNLRENDILCRFGGEEFCALLPQTEIKQAFQVAERIRANVDSQEFTIDNISFPISISIGVADLIHSPKQSLMGLIGYADQALYKAKRKGRNQVSLFNQIAE
ncbi:MAG: hypothetical protein CL609_04905 [Anaerolineaceae bacterium]|nr:hypothetical protein [Anaerolineaceae bacterium]